LFGTTFLAFKELHVDVIQDDLKFDTVLGQPCVSRLVLIVVFLFIFIFSFCFVVLLVCRSNIRPIVERLALVVVYMVLYADVLRAPLHTCSSRARPSFLHELKLRQTSQITVLYTREHNDFVFLQKLPQLLSLQRELCFFNFLTDS
jgi:hypothetical protein